MELLLFQVLHVTVAKDDWDYLCKRRFFTDAPSTEQIEAEFVTGTGITPNKKHLWDNASELFAEYIQDLREIQQLDINQAARNLLTSEEKYS